MRTHVERRPAVGKLPQPVRHAPGPGSTPTAEQTATPPAASVRLDAVAGEPSRPVPGPGQPLPAGIRAEMESRFRADFSDVRIHTGEPAAAAAEALKAEAYTTGPDIVFARGTFAPYDSAGRLRLAHELAHVLQQRAGPVSGRSTAAGWLLSDPADPFERAAEAAAQAALTGSLPPRSGGAEPPRTSAAVRVLQRRTAPGAVADRAPAASLPDSPWVPGTPSEPLHAPPLPAARDSDSDEVARRPVDPLAEPVLTTDPPPASPAVAPAPPAAELGDPARVAVRTRLRAPAQTLAEAGVATPAERSVDTATPATGLAPQRAPAAAGPVSVGPGGVIIPLVLPELPGDSSQEFGSLVATDREGQLSLHAAVAGAVTSIREVFAAQHAQLDEGVESAQAAIGAAVTDGRRQVAGAKATARTRIDLARADQGAQITRQIDVKKGFARGEVARIATDATAASARRADDAQHARDAAAGEVEAARDRTTRTARTAGEECARGAYSAQPDPEINRLSIQGQQEAAHRVAEQTAQAIANAIGSSARDLRSGGPPVRDLLAGHVAPLIQQIREQTQPVEASLTQAGTRIGADLDRQVVVARAALESTTRGVLHALGQIEHRSRDHLHAAAATTRDGLRTAETTAQEQLQARTTQFIDESHAQLLAHLQAITSRPLRRRLARIAAAQLQSVVRGGYGMGVSQTNQLSGRVAVQLSSALAQFHAELAASTAPALAGVRQTSGSGAQQLAALQRQVIAALSRSATAALGDVDVSLTRSLERLNHLIDVVDHSLDPLVQQIGSQANDGKNQLIGDATAKLENLDDRLDQAREKARDRAELGAFGAWLWDQVRSLGHALLTPSFWAGLLVGLLVTIFIIATFGAGAAVLVIAGAVAGAMAAAASYLAQVYVDPLVDPHAERREFRLHDLLIQTAIGAVAGAVGGGVGAGVAGGLGANAVTATARTLAINRVAQTAVGVVLGSVQNCVTGPDGLLPPSQWTTAHWDEGLLTNVAVSVAMSSHRMEKRIGNLTNRARATMVERGLAMRVTPAESHALLNTWEARAGLDLSPAPSEPPVTAPPPQAATSPPSASPTPGPERLRLSYPTEGSYRYESGPQPEHGPLALATDAEIDQHLSGLEEHAPADQRVAGRLELGDMGPYDPAMPQNRAARDAGTFRSPLEPPGPFAYGAPGAPPQGPFHGAMGRSGVNANREHVYYPAEVFGVLPSDHPSYAVRSGLGGSYVDIAPPTVAEARAYAERAAARPEAGIRADSSLPLVWPDGRPGNAVDAMRVFEIQPETTPGTQIARDASPGTQPEPVAIPLARPVLHSGVAPQPETHPIRVGTTLPGGGPQIQLPYGTLRPDSAPVHTVPIPDRMPVEPAVLHDPTSQLRPPQALATPAERTLQNETGIPVRHQREFARLGREHGVEIDVRPTNREAPNRLLQGHRPKPEAIKAKSITPLDTHLGFRREDVGLVGYREPTFPDLARLPAEVPVQPLLDRYYQRLTEFWDLGLTMNDLERPPDQRTMPHHGFNERIVIDEHGVIRTERPNPTDPTGPGAGFTGDNDVFQIRDAVTGEQVTGERYRTIVNDLRAANISVEHGAHMNWGAPPNQEGIFHGIVNRHVAPAAPTVGASSGRPPTAPEELVSFGAGGTRRTLSTRSGPEALAAARAAAIHDALAPNAPPQEHVTPANLPPFLTPDEVATVLRGIADPPNLTAVERALRGVQWSTFTRFVHGLPPGAQPSAPTQGPGGTVRFTAVVPGRAPGSHAVYIRTVDRDGTTVSYRQLTVAPDGSVTQRDLMTP